MHCIPFSLTPTESQCSPPPPRWLCTRAFNLSPHLSRPHMFQSQATAVNACLPQPQQELQTSTVPACKARMHHHGCRSRSATGPHPALGPTVDQNPFSWHHTYSKQAASSCCCAYCSTAGTAHATLQKIHILRQKQNWGGAPATVRFRA